MIKPAMLPGLLKTARRVVASALPRGGIALDGTAGRGRDTLFLARWVGPAGRVWSFDVQRAAIEETRLRLERAGILDRVSLMHAGHETLAAHVERVDAAMFNLGYLPGSDKSVITHESTTIVALDAALARLSMRGALVVAAYPGHAGGRAETDAVDAWFRARGREGREVVRHERFARSDAPPILYALVKR